MAEKRTTYLDNTLIWLGASVSLAEILSGTYLAPLGFAKGILSILIGHVIGCALLFLAGYIGGQTRKSAMQTVTLSFGQKGSYLFAFLNVLQLIGWTAIMIYDGSLAADGIFATGHALWAVVIGVLILVWILIGIENLGRINTVAMSGLLILTVILSVIIFRSHGASGGASGEAMSFGAAIELSVAMPLSWLPVISDYTREAEKPAGATLCSVLVYGIGSSWMYLIGMGAAILTGTSDIAVIMLRAGLGVLGLLIVVLSTVTTTFLDAWSAGVSSEIFSGKIKGRHVAIAATVIGTIGAVIYPMDDISGFLYLIGSVFAPMISIMIVDYFVLHESHEDSPVCIRNIVIWLIGFLLYRKLMAYDLIIGSTLVDMAVTMVICYAAAVIQKTMAKGKN